MTDLASSIATIPIEAVRPLSGLEVLQRICDGRFPPPPICTPINFKLHAVERGRIAFRGTPAGEHMNYMGGTHGGWFGVLLDSCMSCAVQTELPAGRGYTTLEYKVNITRGLPPGLEVEAIGTTDHVGRTTGVARGEIRGVKDGKLYATGTVTCLLMDLP